MKSLQTLSFMRSCRCCNANNYILGCHGEYVSHSASQLQTTPRSVQSSEYISIEHLLDIKFIPSIDMSQFRADFYACDQMKQYAKQFCCGTSSGTNHPELPCHFVEVVNAFLWMQGNPETAVHRAEFRYVFGSNSSIL